MAKNSELVVYKYRDWCAKYHKETLTKNEFYLASPADYNDPFDCRINENFGLLKPEEKEEYKRKLFSKHREQIKDEDLKRIKDDFDKRFSDTKSFQAFADEDLYDRQNKHYGIFSCSLKWNSILMWSHYANSHKGFCIGLNAEKIKESGLFGKLGSVKYEKEFPAIKPKIAERNEQLIEDSFIQTHTKAENWCYEEEYRFSITTFPEELTLSDRVVNLPDECFVNVILGIYIPEVQKEAIVQLCREKKIQVYQAKKADFKFEIIKERIS